jgi:esterase/lipase superfamily enzyme
VTNQTVWDSVRDLIRRRELIGAVEALEEFLKGIGASPKRGHIQGWLDELILHDSSARAVETAARRREITKEEEAVQLLQISRSILSLIGKMEEDLVQSQFKSITTSELEPKREGSTTKKILIFAANPMETDRLQIDAEIRIIRQRLEEDSFGRDYQVESEWAARATDLSKFLMQYKPVIVHFSGHGSPTGDIVLQDDTGGVAPLSVEKLANLFKILKGSTGCVVLNACYSFERANLLADYVGCVVGMEKAIGDPSALRFSAGFYRGIAFGKNYRDAFRLGCNEIDLAALPDSSIPQFTTRNESIVSETVVETGHASTSLKAPARTWLGPVQKGIETELPDGPRLYPVWFGTNRRPEDSQDLGKGFSADRAVDDATVYFGICHVAVPKSHKFGSVGSAWWKRLLTANDDRLRLTDIRSLDKDAFWLSARRALAQRDPGERIALVFIHGFRVTFEEAAIRAAQIGFDLKVPGLTAFFSWPSKGRLSLLDYTADEAAIEASADKIREFLVAFAQRTEAERVHVIAHSMGNRGVLRAMEHIIAKAAQYSKKPFRHLIFAAPDVDATVFRDLARNYRDIAECATLYVSSHDRAVESSGIIHDAPRAGFVPPVTLVDGIDTIEVSNVDLTLLGHGYYGAAEGVLYDMRELLIHDTPPKSRARLNESGHGYWTVGQ